MSIIPEFQPSRVEEYDPAHYDNMLNKLDGVFSLAGGYDYEVWESLPQGNSGVLASKHRGAIDPLLIALVASREYQRQVRFLAAQHLLDSRIRGPIYARLFTGLGGIILDQKLPLDEQPAGQQVKDAIAAGHILGVFPEAKVVPGPILGKTRRIGGLAIDYRISIQAVGVAGTEPSQWVGPKYAVLGRTSYPELDKLDKLDPKDRRDRRSLLNYAKTFSNEVDAAIQEASTIAERTRSIKRVSFSSPKDTPKHHRSLS